MKKILLFFLAVTGMSAVHAYDYPYLTVQDSDGRTHALAVETLTLTIVDGQLVAQNAEETYRLDLKALSKMYFTADATGIDEITADDGSVSVYTTGGVLVGRFASAAAAHSRLKRGVYVMKTNGTATKTVIR